MDSSCSSEPVRKEILALVGQGHTPAEIESQLGPSVTEKDIQYATILTTVRDSLRSEKLGKDPQPAAAVA